MTLPRCVFRFFVYFAAALAVAARAHGLAVDTGPGSGDWKFYSSPAMVEGRPAIAYVSHDVSGFSTEVKYVRASDGNGTAWGTPVTVATGSSWGKVSLLVVNGKPAVGYVEQAKLKYVRAADPTGSTWGAPVALDAAISSGWDFSMEVVDGNPAFCYSDGNSFGLRYLRAEDAAGVTWGPVATALGTAGKEPVLKVVDGRPAVAYSFWNVLMYASATDAAGSIWSAPVIVARDPETGPSFNVLLYPSMQVVNGRPAISYVDEFRAALMYVRASDAAGAVWPAPLRASTPGAAVRFSSLAVVNGRPAIGYYGIDGLDLSFDARDLEYVEALNGDGTAWGQPVTVDSTGDVGTNPALFAVNGSPALTYHDTTHGSLRYTRATTDGAGTRWPPDIRVEQPAGTIIADGGVRDLGVVVVGSTVPISFTVWNSNTGSITLTDIAVTIDGPNAAEFSVITPPSATLAGGISTPFTVQYAPVTPGVKTAVLHVVTNAEGAIHSHDITLTADSSPGIVVERPAGISLTDGGTVSYPFPPPGTVTDLVFTVKNPGGADLSGLALSLGGLDAGEFSILMAPAATVPPGGSSSFTVRHIMGAAGGKTADLHLASNLTGSRNPFDVAILVLTGQPDLSFAPVDGNNLLPVAVQADGKVLTGFYTVKRYLPDGSLDGTFSPVTAGPPGGVICLAVQKDGRILMGGTFTGVNGVARQGLVRVNADSSLDGTFDAGLNGGVNRVVVQPDGRIVAAGAFTSVHGIPRPGLVRLGADGSLDASFNPGAAGSVLSLALQPDGKIVIGAQTVARLNANGIVDDTFAQVLSGGVVNSLILQPDGKILAGGTFSDKLVRLLPTGLKDVSLTFAWGGNNNVYDLSLQVDGKCLIAGGSGYPRLTRINAGGTQDLSFAPDIRGEGVGHMALQADGKVFITGDFDEVGDLEIYGFARLENGAASAVLMAEAGSTVRWLRSGTAPEVRDVTFELNAAGSPDWVPLGAAHRLTGGWELTGLVLPASGNLRARGYAGGSVMETVTPILTAIEFWRMQHFGAPVNAGAGADNADPDHDGLVNLVEFAFGLSPLNGGSNALPEFRLTGNSFTASFTAPLGRDGIIYGAEWSPTMMPGTWVKIPDTGAGGVHTFTAPGGAERVFVRWAVGAQ